MPLGQNRFSTKKALLVYEKFFFCPFCSIWRSSIAASKLLSRPRTRNASTLISTTAVNATKNIPTRNLELYDALQKVKKNAYAQVNLTRLQLALQGLESEAPTTRVAVLGLNVPDTAKRIVRLLLADALKPEEKWEKQLLESEYSNGLIIRYGDVLDPSLQQARSVLPVLTIPATILEKSNVEILVTCVNAPNGNRKLVGRTVTTADAILAPMVGNPANASGRQTSITQPVHKAMLVAEGLDQLVRAAELLSDVNFSSESESDMVDLVVNMQGESKGRIGKTTMVDVQRAEEGLGSIRSSLRNATVYEHKWLESGMPELSTWLSLSSGRESEKLSDPVRNLVVALLEGASMAIASQVVLEGEVAKSTSLGTETLASLDKAIADFSSQAHRELQSGLSAAWSSRNWRKLAWYKLFWRVDDVGLIVIDLINNAWLPQTEKAVYEISGRLLQVGIQPSVFDDTTPDVKVVAVKEPEALPNSALLLSSTDLSDSSASVTPSITVSVPGQDSVVFQQDLPAIPALASTISLARRNYIARAVTGLTFSAQQIVLKTLSISGLTAGLSGLAYFSITGGSLYESATIVALGTAYALRRMQGDWQAECKALEDGLLEEGRNVLRQTEDQMRTLVHEDRSRAKDALDFAPTADAELAVSAAKEALRKLS